MIEWSWSRSIDWRTSLVLHHRYRLFRFVFALHSSNVLSEPTERTNFAASIWRIRSVGWCQKCLSWDAEVDQGQVPDVFSCSNDVTKCSRSNISIEAEDEKSSDSLLRSGHLLSRSSLHQVAQWTEDRSIIDSSVSSSVLLIWTITVTVRGMTVERKLRQTISDSFAELISLIQHTALVCHPPREVEATLDRSFRWHDARWLPSNGRQQHRVLQPWLMWSFFSNRSQHSFRHID